MNKRNRLFSLLLVLAMVFSLTVSVCAQTEVDEKGSILIKDNDVAVASQMTFYAYPALELKTYTDDSGTNFSFEYTVPESLTDFYATRYNADKTTEDFITRVCEGIEKEVDLVTFINDITAVSTEDPYTGTAVEGGYQFGDLPLGYYAIVSVGTDGSTEPVACIILNPVTPDREVVVKNQISPVDDNVTPNEPDADQGTEGNTAVNDDHKTEKQSSSSSGTLLVILLVLVLMLTVAVIGLAISFIVYVRKNKKSKNT